MAKIKVLIVDDSAIVRELLTNHLSGHPLIEVVGSASDAYVARNKIASLKPDVITLDIEMPRMDGVTFLRHLMKSYPLPVIILSSLLQNQQDLAITALECGAFDLVPKPGGPYSVGDVVQTLIDRILAARKFDVKRVQKKQENLQYKKEPEQSKTLAKFKATNKVLAFGASTGGTIAYEKVFSTFTRDMPPTLAVIHMPAGFTTTFAQRLNSISDANIKEAVANEKIQRGTVYIAPGGYHMRVKTFGTDQVIKIVKGPKVHNCKPAVDVLFDSVAENIGQNSCGILLTGMGRDGAAGLLNIRNSGGYTIAQDESTSIVFGMPKEAITLNAAEKVLPLHKIHSHIVRHFLKE